MQTLQQEQGPSSQGLPLDGHPALGGANADQASLYAEEVRSLRQRVAALETELASAKAALAIDRHSRRGAPSVASIEPTPPCRANPPAGSVFAEPETPAVVAVTPPAAPPARAGAAEPLKQSRPDGFADPGFAEAWQAVGETPSFEERLAEKAFFMASSVDEESREWLLA